ncbi:thermonuclease family protein [Microbaculum marinum]|uniref:Thermonuclease family protein n=1 Tax=Microbaculum marinum TaxID=1764581 RepID=A0AAW9S1F9_9HYPH
MRLVFCTLALVAVATIARADTLAGTAAVIDGDTIEVAGVSVRLYGIDAPEAGQKCAEAGSGTWECGTAATEAMAVLVEDEEVTCEIRGKDDFDRLLGVCKVDGVNVNERMVSDGHAWAFVKYASDYVPAEEKARAAALGVWQAPTMPPWEYRAQRWAVAEQEAPEGCPIKGNISSNGRIYHPPWSPWYSRTKIDTGKGERWFCSEGEALEAGWRAPRWR